MVIGITGNFGVGKTTVANMFRRLGARVIDADRIAHTIIRPYSSVYKQIIACFGKKILVGPYISRKRLAKTVFSDKKKLNLLNRITHSKILEIIKSGIKKKSQDEILVIDAPLLIESGLLPSVDKLVVVKLKPVIQMQRLKKNGLGLEQIKGRISAQLPQNKKVALADFVIDNSGSRSQTQKQVREIWDKINEDII